MTARALWRRARPVRVPVILALAYLALVEGFVRATPHDGLLTPEGPVRGSLVALGAAVIGLRLVVLGVVPALLVFRLVRWLVRWLAPRSRPAA